MAEQYKMELLYTELKDCNDNLQRSLTDLNKLLALGLPAITGGFAVLSKNKGTFNLDNPELYSLLALLLGVLAVSFNGIWLQILSFVRYKYSRVLPELYKEAGSDRENYGQYSLREGTLKTFASAFIAQSLLLPSASFSLYAAYDSCEYGLFFFPALLTIGIAIFSTFLCWKIARVTSESIRGMKEHPQKTNR